MEERNETMLTGYPNVISYNCSKNIIEQMEKNIFKIKIGLEQGSGFFCKIPFPTKENLLPVLITNNHVINENILYKKDEIININIKNEENIKKINLNNRIKYTNDNYDVTIIEVKEEDNINNYLDLDDYILNDILDNHNSNKDYLDKTVYIIQYPEGDLSVSYGIIEGIFENENYNFQHKCSTKRGSSGSPILNISNNKVLELHKKGGNNYNMGAFLNYAIKEFIQSNCFIYKNENSFEYEINQIFLNEINKKFNLDIKNIRIENSKLLMEKYLDVDGFKELKELILAYKNQLFYDLNFNKEIIKQMKKNICKINVNNCIATGFFCKIPFPTKDNMLRVFITNHHVLNENFLNKENENINLYIEEDHEFKRIKLNNRLKYTDKIFDVTIIEIKDDDDIHDFLELDNDIINNILNDNNKNIYYIKNIIYVIQYTQRSLSVSYGIIRNIIEDSKFNFIYECETESGSSGSPILNKNNKVIAFHRETRLILKSLGTFINYPIKDFIKKMSNNNINNEIVLPDEKNNKINIKENSSFKYNLIRNIFGSNIFEELRECLYNYSYIDRFDRGLFVNLECNYNLVEILDKDIICNIRIANKQSIAFFCKIPLSKKSSLLCVITTDYSELNDISIINERKIEIKIRNKKGTKTINLNNRFIYTNNTYGITIIEIKYDDDIRNFLELDDIIIDEILNDFDKNKYYYLNALLCMVQYIEEKLSVSYGTLRVIDVKDQHRFYHNCYATEGSSGSPIFRISNNKIKIIGIHNTSKKRIGVGTFLYYPIKDFIKKYNL